MKKIYYLISAGVLISLALFLPRILALLLFIFIIYTSLPTTSRPINTENSINLEEKRK